jgi:hypothetical protein
VAGFYRVSAARLHCQALDRQPDALTRPYEVPPAPAALLIKLRCPELMRVEPSISLHAQVVEQGAAALLTVAVRDARHPPSGLVTFVGARGTLQTLPLNPRSGTAALVVATRTGRSFDVRYAGDGFNEPVSTHASL